MQLAMLAAHLGNASLDEVSGWSLRQCSEVVSRYETVLPLLNSNASADRKDKPITDPKAQELIAHSLGLVKRR